VSWLGAAAAGAATAVFLGAGAGAAAFFGAGLGAGALLAPVSAGLAGWVVESAEAEAEGAAWAALSLGAAAGAPVTALSADWVAVSARRSPLQAAISTTAVSVADSVLVIVVLSLVVWPFPAVSSRYLKIASTRLVLS